jgi:adenylate cyclase
MMHDIDTGLLAMPSRPPERLALGKAIGTARPPADDIRGELQRVVESPAFDASDRNRRFLRYVVEETLEGRADRIKAYNIATIVFGRDVGFDPQLDPVVRMEAQRLRRSLERFYLTEGRDSAVWIFLPKGGYVPEFRGTALPSAAGSQRASRSAGDREPAILVTLFDVEGDQPAYQLPESGLSNQLMIGLSRHRDLTVIRAGFHRHGPAEADWPLAGREADYVLTGSRAVFAGIMQVKALLLEAQTGKVLWGRSFERAIEPKGVLSARDEIANAIVRALSRPGELPGIEWGVAGRSARKRQASDS